MLQCHHQETSAWGPNLAVLQGLGEQFRQRMDQVPYVIHSSTNLIGGAPKVVFHLDEQRLRLANLQLVDAASALNDSLRGRVGGEVLEGTERLPVRVRLRESDWGTPDRIADIRLPLASPSGTVGLVSALTARCSGVEAWPQPNGIATRPGCTRSLGVASIVSEPRSLCTRTVSPSARPSRSASAGWTSRRGWAGFGRWAGNWE